MTTRDCYLVVSGHDYRSKRKASIHFIARELAKRSTTRFFSVGFSAVSRFKKDPRLSLWSRSNHIETFENVSCYLWRTLLHPFNLHYTWLRPINDLWFRLYIDSIPSILIDWVKSSDTIILESGMPPIFFDLVRKNNSKAKILYMCSDSLKTIDCAPFIMDSLKRVSPLFTTIRIPSAYLKSEFTGDCSTFIIPHGMDPIATTEIESSPYSGGINIVSVGQTLFDRSFFEIAAPAFPEINFHIIGGGPEADKLSFVNVTIHPEMEYILTIPYLKFADVGVAPYDARNVATYLIDTSLKLAQFAALGLPSVCPHLVVGDHIDRIGYSPGNRDSIVSAVESALRFGRFDGRLPISWTAVVDRILDPKSYPDTYSS